jgi:hypothetical protein
MANKMKTPQQIRNEVEKEIEDLRQGCGNKIEDNEEFDLDCGEEIDNPNSESGCSFLLCEECKEKLIKAEAKLSILTEYDKSIKEMIEEFEERLISLLTMDGFGYHPEKEQNRIIKRDVEETCKRVIKELLSKIGDNSEEELKHDN